MPFAAHVLLNREVGERTRFHERLANTVRDLEPRVAAFLAFANDDGTEVTGLHVFSDADALNRYMGVLAEQVGVLAEDMDDEAQLLW